MGWIEYCRSVTATVSVIDTNDEYEFYKPFGKNMNNLLPKNQRRIVEYSSRFDSSLGDRKLSIIHNLCQSHEPALKRYLRRLATTASLIDKGRADRDSKH